jgi:L-threonylcarbamoyladenylate synthase
MQTHIVPIDDPASILLAYQIINKGSLVAFPTDTVYGVGAKAFDPQAIDRLYKVKGRDTSKAIPILVGEIAALAQVTSNIGPTARRLAENFWPGPLTLVVPRHPSLPPNLSPLPTIGVRMPDYQHTLDLLKRTGPLAVTSANLSGEANTTTAQEVFGQLKGRIPLILDGGKTPGGLPSTVVDCTGHEIVILRQGPITMVELLSAIS